MKIAVNTRGRHSPEPNARNEPATKYRLRKRLMPVPAWGTTSRTKMLLPARMIMEQNEQSVNQFNINKSRPKPADMESGGATAARSALRYR